MKRPEKNCRDHFDGEEKLTIVLHQFRNT
jgi:hypothetical protein